LDFHGDIVLIANFAAIHREPGYEDAEYFETNLLGAENVCKFAEKVGCQNIIFTGSISLYGVSESVKDELTLPVPVTAYGASKLTAEKIHQIWRAKDANDRRLVIVRPGVVFGPGEGGNVSRLIRSVIHRYFFFMGNQSSVTSSEETKPSRRKFFFGASAGGQSSDPRNQQHHKREERRSINYCAHAQVLRKHHDLSSHLQINRFNR
jgi:nucleoside-diphosphate-sugar epimerase